MTKLAGANVVGWRKGRMLTLGLVPGLLFVDMVNGVVGGSGSTAGLPSPAELVRGGVLLWALTVAARAQHGSLRKLQLWVVGILALGSAGMLLGFFRTGNGGGLLADLAALSKALYGPALVLLLVVLARRHSVTAADLVDCVAWVGGIAGISIVLLTVTGLSFATYIYQQVGSKGLFISQNDIGLAMGIGLIAATHLAISRGRLRYMALVVATLAGMLLLGTRAAMLGAFIIPTVMVIIQRPRERPTWRRALMWATTVLVVGAGLLAAGVWEYRTIQTEHFQQEKLQRLAENPFVRGLVVASAFQYVRHRPLLETVFGEGLTAYSRGVAATLHLGTDRTLAEVDWMDMFGEYGALFAVLIYVYYTGFFLRARGRREEIGPSLSRTIEFAVAWFLAHSVIAGHAVAGTIPASTLAPFLALAWDQNGPARLTWPSGK